MLAVHDDLPAERDSLMEVVEFIPYFDVSETVDGYLFRADVPGVRERDLEVIVAGNRMTIAGKREADVHGESDTFYARERSYGAFRRTFSLPEQALLGSASAELEGGVLTVRVRKRGDSSVDVTRP